MKFLFGTIRKKVFFLLFIIFSSFMLLYFVLKITEIQAKNFDSFQAINDTIQKILYDNTREYIYNNNTEAMQIFISSIENKYIKSIHIVSREGKILTNNNSHIKEDCQYFTNFNPKDKAIIKNKDNYAIIEPFLLLDVPLAYLVVIGNLDGYNKDVTAAKVELFQILLLSLFLLLLSSLYIAKSISQPIETLVNKLRSTNENKTLDLGTFEQVEFAYLSQIIQSKHNSLQKLNNNLGLEVLSKTNELQKLNISLQEKVKVAVEESRKKDQMILQQNRLAQMGEMLSMIAHQWRQPLSAITSTSSAIELIATLGKTKKDDLIQNAQNISEYAQHLSATINEFRDFFKPSTKKSATSYEDIIQSVLNIIQSSLESKAIKIELDFTLKETFKTYPNKIKQVVLNLIKNAEDILLEKEIQNATITIRTYKQDNANILSISDNGGGIPNEIMDFIFDPYFTTKQKRDGTGLGLYMSKTIIDQHCDGKLDVTNIQDGANFTITLRTT